MLGMIIRRSQVSQILKMFITAAGNSTYKKIYGSVSKPCTPVVHIKIAGKWMFIPLKMVLIGIDPYPYKWIKLIFRGFIPLLIHVLSTVILIGG